jgi:hypothetical protein
MGQIWVAVFDDPSIATASSPAGNYRIIIICLKSWFGVQPTQALRKKRRKKPKRQLKRSRRTIKKVLSLFSRPYIDFTVIPTAGNNVTSVNEDKGLDALPLKDEDPDGLKLISSPDPLERAAKCLRPLKTLGRENVDVWIAVYDVAVRRSKLKKTGFFLKWRGKVTLA